MKKLLFLIGICAACVTPPPTQETSDLTTLFERSKGTETPTYSEVISYYQKLADHSKKISLFEMGSTDAGRPLHLAVYNPEGPTKLSDIHKSKKVRFLINNGIHPGESDGIDASMLLLRDLIQNDSLQQAYSNSLLCVIPIYNIGGALQRNSHTRANQNGPKEYGFRGNARNYDLNRDFIKADTKNAASFAKIFHLVAPDIFIDNHVSNGADYQYAITHLFTQHNKLGSSLGNYLEQTVRPNLEARLAKKGIPITPYVNVWGSTPKKGWSQFFDSPRYSTGYTSLFHTLGMMVETHMLKPYQLRVTQTYELMGSMLAIAQQEQSKIKDLRKQAEHYWLGQKKYPIHYQVNKETPSALTFKGYEGRYVPSKVTTGQRLFYDRDKPYTETVNYYNTFEPTKYVEIPKAYVLKSGWNKVVAQLKNNQIQFRTFTKDTVMTAAALRIENFETRTMPYEGHYLHYGTQISTTEKTFQFKKGDLYIPTQQIGIRYLLETLEPAATDSFFNWNYFDTVLQRKEGFSAYVFEDIAEKLLAEDEELQMAFRKKMTEDTDFAHSPYAQLDYIYKNSPHYEPTHMTLPIFKIH